MKLPVLFCLLFPLLLSAQKNEPFAPENIKIDWQLVTNHYQSADQYLATFRLTNDHKKAVWPASGWTIYFNALRYVVKKDVGYGLMMEHIHGDLFRLYPTAAFKGLKAQESIMLECISDAWAFNVSDAPAGFYWVWDATPNKSQAIRKVTIAPPADIEKFKRGPDQPNDQITPEMVFEQNKNISDLPEAQLPKIFPTPVSYQEKSGQFTLNTAAVIATAAPFEAEAEYLAVELQTVLGTRPRVESGQQGAIRLRTDPSLAREAYALEVTPTGIEIAASEPAGMFYGIQSLKCLLPPEAWKQSATSYSLPCLSVKDSPRFGYRGLHMDVARNFQSKAEVLRILRWMALYKLNTLHFHFSDDEGWRLEIPELPELTTVGVRRGHTLDSKENLPATYGSGGDTNNSQSGYYTRADYIDILKTAKSLHIEVIPEIETPGHARAAIKAMDARFARLTREGKPAEALAYLLADPEDKSVYNSAQNYTDNVMCVALPSVYHFIETTVDALIDMHRQAGMPLKTIHMGGDEVPGGVWEKSPLCQSLLRALPSDRYRQTSDLWLYYWEKVNAILKARNLYVSGWEEIGMRETKLDGNRQMMVNPLFANEQFHTYVWNTVIGWGTEDLPYRLANGGYKVVLCPVSNLYFDLAYQKDFYEPGYYWGGFLDMDKPFYFIPYDYLKNTKVDRFGNPIDPKVLTGKDRLTDYGKSNIVGIQGHLWSENLRSAEALEYAVFPKVLALAERAWAADPDWAQAKDARQAEDLYRKAWNTFVNTVGKKELPRLAWYQGGAAYRIPMVGARIENGAVVANIQIPGLDIRYTTDGTEPTLQSPRYTGPIVAKGLIRLRAFDRAGRGGRAVQVELR